jgi:hypothetical protein
MLTGEHGVWGCGVYCVVEQLCARLQVLDNRQGPAGVSAPGSPHFFVYISYFFIFPVDSRQGPAGVSAAGSLHTAVELQLGP